MSVIWTPKGYQKEAVKFLFHNPCSGLFLDPGLGKTSISLSAMKHLLKRGLIKGVLIIAPLRVVYTVWPEEIKKWRNFNGFTYKILHDKTKKLNGEDRANIYLINPEGLPWLEKTLLEMLKKGEPCPFDALWIDESTKFKNHKSKRFKILKNLSPLFARKHIMTGTPAPKGLLDLWAQMYILDKGELLGKSYYQYRLKYFRSTDWNQYNWIPFETTPDKIHKLIAPKVLEMSSKDYLDLPDITYNTISVTLPDAAAVIYKQMEKEFFISTDQSQATAPSAATAGIKCHQIANGRVYEDAEGNEDLEHRKTIPIHTAKLDAVNDLTDELNGKPLLVGYHYKHDLEALIQLFGRDTPHIGSGVSAAQTQKIINRWNAGKIKVLLGHPASMGHGLNLQAGGNDICWFSLTWNLEEYLQFNARIYRQGVSDGVRVHHIVAKNTIDEAMMMRLGERAKTQQDLRDALKSYREFI